ncbi:MAG: hypothetical protein ACFWUI_06295 [Clostridium sp.]|jgi:hypothetical protein
MYENIERYLRMIMGIVSVVMPIIFVYFLLHIGKNDRNS